MTTQPGASTDEVGIVSLARSADLWRVVFLIGVAVAVPYLLWEGSDYWFFGDDWVFLSRREVGDPATLLESHDGHWVTLPVLEWRLLFGIFGFDYFPYLVVVVASHVGIVACVRLLMLRAGVVPAIATLLSLALLVFGTGHDNVILPFQTTLNGAVLFGLVHLLLADRADHSPRTDGLGLLAGLLALMCSGVAIGMVVGVGVAVLCSRGWRAAALHTVPLGVVYLVWNAAYGGETREVSAIDLILESSARAVHAVFVALTQADALGWLLLVVTAGGVVAAVRSGWADREWRRYSSIAGLLAGGLVLMVLFSYFRVAELGVDYVPSQSRYLHVGAVAFVPVVAIAADFLWRRSPVLGVLPLLLVAIGIPGNLDEFRNRTRGLPEGTLYAVVETDQADTVPDSTFLFGQRFLTMKDVRILAETSAFPGGEPSEADRRFAEFGVALRQSVHTTAAPADCVDIGTWTTLTLEPGDAVEFAGAIQAREPGSSFPYTVRFRDQFGAYLVAHGDTVDVELRARSGGGGEACRFVASPTLEPGFVRIAEGDDGTTEALVPLTLTVPLGDDVTVDWETRIVGDSTATDDDFVAASGTLTIPAGETEAAVAITVVGDTEAEPEDQIAVLFSNPSPGVAVDQTAFGLGFVIVENDD